MFKHLPVFIIFIFAVLGCASTQTIESTQVSPTEIFQSYEISAKQNSTSITATFRVANSGGTTIDLDAPSKLEFNGQPMRESAPFFLKGTTYEFSAKNFIPQGVFQYTDSSGKVYENNFNVKPIEIIENFTEIKRLENKPIQFSRPIEKDERITISIYSQESGSIQTNSANGNANQNTDATQYSTDYQITGEAGKASVTLDSTRLKNFKIGKAKIYITARKEEKIKQGTARGGEIITSFESNPLSVNIVN